MADPNRTHWNQQQQALKRALAGDSPAAIEQSLAQHAMVHAAEMSQAGLWSFEDDIWAGLSDEAARRQPPGAEHSVAWLTWHAARCEDITFNLLVAGCPQVLLEGGWQARLNVPARDTGNAMSPDEIAAFSAAVDIGALRAYRMAVGRQTRAILRALRPGQWKEPVDPARLPAIFAQGAVLPEAAGLVDYWGKQTIAGLILMPATRHPFVHWNEALRMKKKIL